MAEIQKIQQNLNHPGDYLTSVLLENGDTLTDVKLVRIVPNKRLVCQAIWQTQAVFAKIFIGEGAESYAARDQRGVNWLTEAQLATPPLLAVHQLEGQTGTVLIFKAIEHSHDAEDAYQRAEGKGKTALMHALVKTVALHHQANLMQTDMYLKNFLVQGDLHEHFDLYTLDGDGIKRFSSLSEHKAIHNLAVLLSKLDPIDLKIHFNQLLETYMAVRPQVQLKQAKLEKRIHEYRIKATYKYANEKVFRACTDVNVHKSSRYFFAQSSVFQQVELPLELAAYDQLLASGQSLKQGNTCTVGLVDRSAVKLVIKRYNIKNFWHGVSRLFRQTRASVSWSNAYRLQLLGIASPKPVALYEHRVFGCLRGKAYFLSEYVDALDVSQFFAQIKSESLKQTAIKNTVTLFYQLYLLKISHGDTKATNIKMLESGEPMLIDLDSMQQHRDQFSADKMHIKDLKRFMQNWKAEPALYNVFVDAFREVYLDHEILQSAQIL